MENNKLTFLSRLIAGLIFTFLLSFFFFKMNPKETIVKCKNCLETENLIKKENNQNIEEIKNIIKKAHQKEESNQDKFNNTSNKNSKDIFRDNNAIIMGDSFVEGMTAYEVLYDENAVWTRGRRIDNFYNDLEKVVSKNPKILILAYGSNDVQMWDNKVDSFINVYQRAIDTIKKKLPNTTIYICSVFDVSKFAKEKDTSFNNIPLYNEKLKDFTNKNDIKLIDSSFILKENNDPYSYDGIHPKAYFYPKWAKDIINKTNMR